MTLHEYLAEVVAKGLTTADMSFIAKKISEKLLEIAPNAKIDCGIGEVQNLLLAIDNGNDILNIDIYPHESKADFYYLDRFSNMQHLDTFDVTNEIKFDEVMIRLVKKCANKKGE